MPNGVIQSASEYFNDTEKYPGNRGTDTNPFVIADYKDLIGMNSYVYQKQNYENGTNPAAYKDHGGGSYLLVNDIDCSEWDPNKDGPIVLRVISNSTTVIDFNGYSMYNIIIRTFDGRYGDLSIGDQGSCFLCFMFPCIYSNHYSNKGNRIFKNVSFKNVIFHNSRQFQLIGYSRNYTGERNSYATNLKIFYENPSFEVYISEDGTKSSNKFCSLIPFIAKWKYGSEVSTDNYSLKYSTYIKNIYLKLSGREVMRSLSKMTSPDIFKRSSVNYLFGFDPSNRYDQYITDMTLNYNDFVFVLNEKSGSNDLYQYSAYENVTDGYSLAPSANTIDTLNMIGNMTIRVKNNGTGGSQDPAFAIQFFRAKEYKSSTELFTTKHSNILINCKIKVVNDGTSNRCCVFDFTDITYFVNKDRYFLSTSSTGIVNGNYKVFNKFQKAVECTTEQINNAEYMKNQGLVVFNLNT